MDEGSVALGLGEARHPSQPLLRLDHCHIGAVAAGHDDQRLGPQRILPNPLGVFVRVDIQGVEIQRGRGPVDVEDQGAGDEGQRVTGEGDDQVVMAAQLHRDDRVLHLGTDGDGDPGDLEGGRDHLHQEAQREDQPPPEVQPSAAAQRRQVEHPDDDRGVDGPDEERAEGEVLPYRHPEEAEEADQRQLQLQRSLGSLHH